MRNFPVAEPQSSRTTVFGADALAAERVAPHTVKFPPARVMIVGVPAAADWSSLKAERGCPGAGGPGTHGAEGPPCPPGVGWSAENVAVPPLKFVIVIAPCVTSTRSPVLSVIT